jgi:Rod binding domain-containing protein
MNDITKVDKTVQDTMLANNAPPAKAKADEAYKAAQQFEAIFLRMVVKDMRKNATAMTGGGMMGEGVGTDVREGWFDTFMSDHLAATGQVGLADSLYRDWVDAGKVANVSEKSSEEDLNKLDRKFENADNQGLSHMQDAGPSLGTGGL